jgi:hypothetical protein
VRNTLHRERERGIKGGRDLTRGEGHGSFAGERRMAVTGDKPGTREGELTKRRGMSAD